MCQRSQVGVTLKTSVTFIVRFVSFSDADGHRERFAMKNDPYGSVSSTLKRNTGSCTVCPPPVRLTSQNAAGASGIPGLQDAVVAAKVLVPPGTVSVPAAAATVPVRDAPLTMAVAVPTARPPGCETFAKTSD